MPEHGFYFFCQFTETRALSHKTKFLYFIEITPGTTASKQHEIVALKTGIQYGFFFFQKCSEEQTVPFYQIVKFLPWCCSVSCFPCFSVDYLYCLPILSSHSSFFLQGFMASR